MSNVISAGKLAEIVEGKLEGNAESEVRGVNSLSDALEEHASFLGNKKYSKQVNTSRAGVILVKKDYDGKRPKDKTFIYCDNVDVAFSKAIMVFAPPPVKFVPEIHPSAFVDKTASIGKNVHVGPCAVVERGAFIGSNSVIAAGSYIGPETILGEGCLIYPNVSIRERCVLGKKIIIHSGTTVGSDGYGFIPGASGIVKLPQVGIVQIDDDVEIGANCAIDRARFGKTWLKRGVKLDNMVHVAHNVEVGECSLLIGQCGIAGSTKIGRGVIVAAQAGINGHITLGDGCKVAGTSGVVKSVEPGREVVGTPAEPPRDFLERIAVPKKVKRLNSKVKELEQQLEALKRELKK